MRHLLGTLFYVGKNKDDDLQGFQNLVGMFDIFSIPTRSKKDLAGVIRSFIFLVGKGTDCKSALSGLTNT